MLILISKIFRIPIKLEIQSTNSDIPYASIAIPILNRRVINYNFDLKTNYFELISQFRHYNLSGLVEQDYAIVSKKEKSIFFKVDPLNKGMNRRKMEIYENQISIQRSKLLKALLRDLENLFTINQLVILSIDRASSVWKNVKLKMKVSETKQFNNIAFFFCKIELNQIIPNFLFTPYLSKKMLQSNYMGKKNSFEIDTLCQYYRIVVET
ncbi:unnamed protein product (macronuclear) [Paramecium tetraurelia]|uniref:Uncharacterized protein n=1 Tax=Paramecium tetraurelia TaxID=5888 RepID=A0EH53_PARTE|nr:uncharacterized protein GSPATT00026968001 [Paramecium tetraurelia]CAK94644.1 unnamed protein product [Paramecium tetraurelia]|eukprot:XP_001462017.1 hypothetical protein (macronuclear) [Paramecium tetraurelia strain d4-2]